MWFHIFHCNPWMISLRGGFYCCTFITSQWLGVCALTVGYMDRKFLVIPHWFVRVYWGETSYLQLAGRAPYCQYMYIYIPNVVGYFLCKIFGSNLSLFCARNFFCWSNQSKHAGEDEPEPFLQSLGMCSSGYKSFFESASLCCSSL